MHLESIRLIVQWIGGLLAFVALGFVLYGVWRGTQRQAGRTTMCFVCFAPLMFVGTWREEAALSAGFGEQWNEYCKHVAAFIPRIRR